MAFLVGITTLTDGEVDKDGGLTGGAMDGRV
jgi:hypothetical protein